MSKPERLKEDGSYDLTPAKSILEEAIDITSGARREAYGHPRESFERIAKMWSAYMSHEIGPRDVAMMMVLLKTCREANSAKRDSLVDIAGYARTAELLDE